MKKICICFLIAFMGMSLCAAGAFATTITVDGTAESAWDNADVARSPDKASDAPAGDANANILDNYITADTSSLYVRFDVAGTAFGTTSNNYLVKIDTDNDPATGESYNGIGADYQINIGGSGGSPGWWSVQQYSGGSWSAVSYSVSIGNSGGVIEIGVSLSDIGSPSGKIALITYAQETVNWVVDYNNDVVAGAPPILYTIGGSGISIDGVLGDWDGSEIIYTDADDNDACIPEQLDMREIGVDYDTDTIYVRINLDDVVIWNSTTAGAYKEYRLWLDTDPQSATGYQPYLGAAGCNDPAVCIHWPDFYADYHLTLASWNTKDETFDDRLFADCDDDDCSDTANLILLTGNEGNFDFAANYKYIEIAIPRTDIPDFDPDCFEAAFTTYDAESLGAGCTTPGDNLPDWGTTDPDMPGDTDGCSEPEAYDFGDAPDPTYPSLLASNGARHQFPTPIHLGDNFDTELDSKQVDADMYDDGVAFLGSGPAGGPYAMPYRAGEEGAIQVTVKGNPYMCGDLSAWMDWNHDGDWDDVGENIICNYHVLLDGNGVLTKTFTFPVPAGTPDGTGWARIRISEQGCINSCSVTGPCDLGEVEDYSFEQTLVELSSLDAHPGNGSVTIEWATASEINNAGFNIYRAESGSDDYEKINDSLIAAEGSATEGASYQIIDQDVQNRKTYSYILEDVDLSGIATPHGPVSATPRLIYGIVR